MLLLYNKSHIVPPISRGSTGAHRYLVLRDRYVIQLPKWATSKTIATPRVDPVIKENLTGALRRVVLIKS